MISGPRSALVALPAALLASALAVLGLAGARTAAASELRLRALPERNQRAPGVVPYTFPAGVLDRSTEPELIRMATEIGEQMTLPQSDGQGSTSIPASKLMLEVLRFAHQISGESDVFANNFRVTFLHAVAAHETGFAWVAAAAQSTYDLEWMAGQRTGVAMGIQAPLLGSDELWLKDEQGQIALRFMPLAANFESVQIGPNSGYRDSDSTSGVYIRPAAELEGTYRAGEAHPGFRFLVQPRLSDASQARMLAEVYLEYTHDIHTPGIAATLHSISVLPRCWMDAATDREQPEGPWASLYRSGYGLLNSQLGCSLSARFVVGY